MSGVRCYSAANQSSRDCGLSGPLAGGKVDGTRATRPGHGRGKGVESSSKAREARPSTSKPLSSSRIGNELVTVISTSTSSDESSSTSTTRRGGKERPQGQRKRQEQVMNSTRADLVEIGPSGWDQSNGGVEISSGAGSIWSSHYFTTVPKSVLRELLAGRPLMYRSAADHSLASQLVQWLRLQGPRTCMDFSEWSRVVTRGIHALHTTSDLNVGTLGSLLLSALSDRPGCLGFFARFVGHFTHEVSRSDVLPVNPLWLDKQSCTNDVRVWGKLMIIGLNYLYCGQNRLLDEACHFPPKPSPVQDRVISHILQVASSWVSGVSLDWSASLNELEGAGNYEPRVCTTAFPLSVETIIPNLPRKEHCSQVDICALVSPDTLKWLLNPAEVLQEPPLEIPASS
eukprot:6490313-Amphidinium_carterae.1